MNTMMVTPVYDDSEAVELNAIYHLYLKPKAKLIISIILPDEAEQCRPISNLDILEELRNVVTPDHFSSLRISRTTKEFIRIEGEVDTKNLANRFLEKLNDQSLPINCLPKPLHIIAIEAPAELPVNDSTTKLLTEIKDDSENCTTPSCLHLEGLPFKWFLPLGTNAEKPSEEVLRSIFEKFGNLVNIDIPMLDPYREDCSENQPGPGGLQTFDVFLQYEEMSNAINAVRSLQGMKLMLAAEDGKSVACDIKISVDENNHFSEEAINKRNAERLKLQELEQQRKEEKEEEEAERKTKLEERKARARKRRARLKRKLQRQKQNEQKALQQQQENGPEEEEDTPEWQERKLVLAQRRLESIQLLTSVLDKVNDLVQVNKLEEEQMICEFAGLSDCSVSTYSENSKVMSLPFSDEENRNHETQIWKKDEVEMTISKEDNQMHQQVQRKDSITENQDGADEDLCMEDGAYEEPDTQMNYDSQRRFKLSKEDPINRSSKKKKIYETDEFINYLLNYYHYPEYARLFLETKDSPSNPWCRRVVRWKGNSFQIKLQNLNGHFAEMNFMPELEEETEDDSGKWNAPIKQIKKKSQAPLDGGKEDSDSFKLLVENEHEIPVTKTPKPHLVKSGERSYKKTWDDDEDSLSSVSNSELKEVLEEISSTSEYFSEDLSEMSGKQTNIRRASMKQRRMKQLKKLKRHTVSAHPQFRNHNGLLDHLLHSYCRLKKQLRCKLTSAHKKKPASQYESETTDSNDTEAQIRATWKRKRAKLKNRICLLEGKKVNKEMYSSSESESSSSEPYQHKGNIWRHHQKGKPRRKVHKTGESDSNEKTSKPWDYCFAEDVSESVEHEESTGDVDETQTSCSLGSSHQTAENKQLRGRPKSSYSDYWEWEQHFYKGDKCKN
ncbi:A-kinase anchor protein 17B-like [Anomaloglossus baeobatrachus]|uniref:A-kinase anchor protein 17B-like n=1 Tax=Anomaloglossus baeobatrachus TaxID=238106 RepID=UPI003F4FCEB5